MNGSDRTRKVGGHRGRWPFAAASIGVAVAMAQVLSGVAIAAGPILSATLSGTAGTALVGATFYAKSSVAVTLTVVTDTSANCVSLSGTHSASSTTPSSSDSMSKTWAFSMTSATGADGARNTTVTASLDPACATSDATMVVSYTVDNTAPTLTATLSPTPNVSGWNKADVTVTWTATDAGSGVASGPTPATATQTVETGGAVKNSTATDRVGNVRNASTSVKLDKTNPSITGTRNPAANVNGWNNTNVTVSFSCSDARSGIRTCSGPSSFTSNVSGQSVTGNALDFADNTSSTTVVVNVDKNAPTISGAPAGSPNGAGWYNADAAVVWTCTDTGGSGFAAGACANSTISTEGTGLTVSKAVSDLAGNSSSTATSTPAVNLDKTSPATTATPSGGGANVTVSLAAVDGLSGVKSVMFTLDGGAPQTYGPANVPTFTAQGSHVLDYWSVDNADNVEAHHTFSTTIDTVPPAITVSKTPAANANGWNNSDVTVTFACADAVSGVNSCPAPVTVTTEGANQTVSGIASDNAGNSASASTAVSVDKSAPSVSATSSPPANANGWNNSDVTVTFVCADAVSGVNSCPAPVTVTTEGAHQTVSGTASDNAGKSTSASTTVSVDKAAPLVSVTGVTPGGTYQQDTYSASCSSSDVLSGVATAATLSTSGGPTGVVTLTCAGAVDRAGNSPAVPVSVQINVTGSTGGGDTYKFGGFLPPVAGKGAVNDVHPGAPVFVRFSLGGYRGMRIFANGYPASVASSCSGTPSSDGLQRVNWPWGAALWYNAQTDTYAFFWFTSPWWSGCRTLVLKFADGSTQVAYFDFERNDHGHDHDHHAIGN